MSSLLPTRVQLPSEIISIIAEATVDPFSLKIDSLIANKNNTTDEVTLTGLPACQLTFISRAFQHGINKGLRNNFTGRLTLRVGYVKHANNILESHGLNWIIPQTRYLHLHLIEDDSAPPDKAADYQHYLNLTSITVTHTRAEMYSDLDYCPVRGKPDNVHNTMGKAYGVLTLLRPKIPSGVMTIVKVVYATGPERVVTAYLNVEVQVDTLRQRIVMRYQTEEMEWDVRSSHAHGE